MKNKVLLINDLPGYGKVALSAMFPVLSAMGCDIYNLPTALVSNTLDYGKFEILDTTEYMKHTLDVWEALNFSFDCICTGFNTCKRYSCIFDFTCNYIFSFCFICKSYRFNTCVYST